MYITIVLAVCIVVAIVAGMLSQSQTGGRAEAPKEKKNSQFIWTLYTDRVKDGPSDMGVRYFADRLFANTHGRIRVELVRHPDNTEESMLSNIDKTATFVICGALAEPPQDMCMRVGAFKDGVNDQLLMNLETWLNVTGVDRDAIEASWKEAETFENKFASEQFYKNA